MNTFNFETPGVHNSNQMSSRPVVSYHGDTQLFKVLEDLILQALPKESVEWKRTYGRPPRAVTLNALFEPFLSVNEINKVLSKKVDKLLGCQVLHTYWIECSDVDTYKSNVRENIQAWFSHLKSIEFQDWLIILVETPESKKSNKILPRTTVLDKIKNDFGGKTPERCIALLDPIKGENKSPESWQTFLFRFRQALIAAFSRALTKFEEVVRTQREHRNELNWNFCNYFLLQEELAFVFQMLGLYDEALVQYDELDALFTQFVLNSAVGDAPQWLSSFQISPNDWSGVCLQADSPFNLKLRSKIQEHTMSVIDFRNYLFSRQCSLLLIASNSTEVAHRCLSYVQSCTHEMKLLNIIIIEGAISTWILLTCLQVLSTCQTYVASTTSHQSMEYFALLWNVAKDKLYELGHHCGLLPGGSIKSSQLHYVVTLSSGISDYQDDSTARPTPVDQLKEALSSKEAFNKHYLELSELAMGTFKHCGRLRSARLIGRDLSKFYIQLGQPQQSVNFLIDLLRGYQEENWTQLKIDTHMELADVYDQIGDYDKFIEASACIATYKTLNLETRLKYFKNLKTSTPDCDRLFSCSTMLNLSSVQIEYDSNNMDKDTGSVLCDSVIRANIVVTSNFPGPIHFDEISITVKRNAVEQKPVASKTTEKPNIIDQKAKEANAVSATSGEFSGVFDLLPVAEQKHLKQDGSLSSVAIVYPNINQILNRRKISQGSYLSEIVVTKEEYANKLMIENVTITPGINHLRLQMKADCEGSYTLNQFFARQARLELIHKSTCPVADISVVKVTPMVTIVKPPEDLLVGIEQPIQLVIRTGSIAFDKEMNLRLSTSRGLTVRMDNENSAFQRELDLNLNPMSPFDTVTFNLVVLADFILTKDATAMEHKLMLECPWLPKSPPLITLPLHVSAPFSVHYKLHTSHARKFVNIQLQGLTPRNQMFEFENPSMKLPESTFTNPLLGKLEWKNLNNCDRSKIFQDQSLHYLWELCGAPAQMDLPLLKGEFSVQFRQEGSTQWKTFAQTFDITHYSTLYTLRSRVEPVKGNDFLRAGSLCHMTLTVTDEIASTPSTSLMYEVLTDQTMWAVCGRTAGVFCMEGTPKHTVTLDVMPLICGFLPLPAVRLSKYIPAEQKSKDGNRKADLGGYSGANLLPRLEPFSPGQVFNWSKALQVHVLATSTNNGVSSTDNSLS